MIARYKVASLATRHEGEDGPGAGRRRVDELRLELEAHEMPFVEARKVTVRAKGPAAAKSLECHGGSIRSVAVIRGSAGCGGEGPYLEAAYLEARCPYCGTENELEHSRWMVALDGPGGKPLLAEPRSGEDAVRPLAGYPSGWMPLPEERISPLLKFEGALEMPFGEGLPLDLLEKGGDGADPATGQRRVFGSVSGYKGIYRCADCDRDFYALNNQCPAGRRVDYPAETAPTRRGAPPEITTTVVSGKRSIEVEFSPAPPDGASAVAFDLEAGLAIADGLQLMKDNRTTAWSLDALPLGFRCPGLMDHVRGLLEGATGSDGREAGLLIASGSPGGAGESDEHAASFAELAVANRFRGYPDAFYEEVLLGNVRRSPGGDGPDGPWIRPFDALPVRFEGIARAYAESGLPRVKSIRRLAFHQPLFISYAKTMAQMPFDDANVLADLLSHDAALSILHELMFATRDNSSAFCCLKETHGEPETWRYVKGLVDAGAPLGAITTSGLGCVMDERCKGLAGSLPIARAAEVLECAHLCHANVSQGAYGEYEHSPSQLRLEWAGGGFLIDLPACPFDLIEAGADLGNCLAHYAYRDDGSRTVLLVRGSSRLEAAIEIDADGTRAIQAGARHNRRIRKGSPLGRALAAWADEKGVSLEPSVLK